MNNAVASFAAAFAASMLAATANATVEISDVSVSQVTGTSSGDVTVAYRLSNGGEPAYVTLDVLTNGVSVGFDHIKTARGDISQLDAHLVADNGAAKSIVWPMRKDWPDQFLKNATVRLQAWYTNAIPPMYLVVDLSGGTAAESFPVRYTTTPPDLTSDVCRTTELWLRQCPAGTYMMSENGNSDDTRQRVHQATLTNAFYCGVFEVTKAQYALVMGDSAAAAARLDQAGNTAPPDGTYPMNFISVGSVRGSGDSYAGWLTDDVAAESFFGVLRAKTGLSFDLPTDAQWEYACRAGSRGRYFFTSGTSSSGIGNNAWYNNNSQSQMHKVGLKNPNAWGLYDVHGNVGELCLDAFTTSAPGDAVTNYVQTTFNEKALLCRGGSATRADYQCSSTAKYIRLACYDATSFEVGFRVWLTIGKWR